MIENYLICLLCDYLSFVSHNFINDSQSTGIYTSIQKGQLRTEIESLGDSQCVKFRLRRYLIDCSVM